MDNDKELHQTDELVIRMGPANLCHSFKNSTKYFGKLKQEQEKHITPVIKKTDISSLNLLNSNYIYICLLKI